MAVTWLVRTSAVVVAVVSLSVLAAPASASPPTPDVADVPVDLYGNHPTYLCNASDPERRGTERFRAMVLAAHPHTRSGDAWAPCHGSAHTATSSHHAGRAWDWFVAAEGSRATPAERAIGDGLVRWLLETVGGEPHMRARRLGIVELIWFDQLWQSRDGYRYLRPYPLQGCPAPEASNTGCHRDHVHIGFSIAGANGDTSWWRGRWGWTLSTIGWAADLAASQVL